MVLTICWFIICHICENLSKIFGKSWLVSKNGEGIVCVHIFFNFFVLTWGYFLILLEREGKKEENNMRKNHQLVAFSHMPNQGWNLQTRHVPLLGIKPANQTCNHLVHETTLQPTQPQWPEQQFVLNRCNPFTLTESSF